MAHESHSLEIKVVIHKVSVSTLLIVFLGLFIVGYTLLKAKQRNEIVLYEQSIYDSAYEQRMAAGKSQGEVESEPPSLRTTVYRKPLIRDLSPSDFRARKSYIERAEKDTRDNSN